MHPKIWISELLIKLVDLLLRQFLWLCAYSKNSKFFCKQSHISRFFKSEFDTIIFIVSAEFNGYYQRWCFAKIIKIFTHRSDSRCQLASSGSDGASGNKKNQRYSLCFCTGLTLSSKASGRNKSDIYYW